MKVTPVHEVEALHQLRSDWKDLAGPNPFRSWEWMTKWAEVYVRSGDLMVLTVHDTGGELVAVAPWYLDRSGGRRTIRWLGSGEVCSEYLSILCRPEAHDVSAPALAEFLKSGRAPAWDLMELGAVDEQDLVVPRLFGLLGRAGSFGLRSEGLRCWRLDLPSDWDELLALLSRSHRKQLRRLLRRIETGGRYQLTRVDSRTGLDRALPELVRLHEARRASLGGSGAFGSNRFLEFQSAVMPALLESGQLRLFTLQADGETIAVDYQLVGGTVAYAYQIGISTDHLREQPGNLITLLTIRAALEEGLTAVDFLRGDEPYKPHWRATPQRAFRYTIAGRPAAGLQLRARLAARTVERALRRLMPGSSMSA